ncbi:DUF2637 domain-containing protein [Actinomadura sp. GTD37]|uniref:DUF2637 domain-containing protein n=1 Tax=Actinomadura sp. GTD37 TaxID=1778030 RepID=UPI0035C25027
MADRLIRITTALAVVAVAAVAAVISYRHAYELVHSHGESGPTARLVPFTVDGLIWAASMVILDASRRQQPAPPLAKWSLAVGIVATVGANVAHGASHGVIGTVVSAWSALVLVGRFKLPMTLTRPPRVVTPSRTRNAQSRYNLAPKSSRHRSRRCWTLTGSPLQDPGRPVSQRYLAEKYGIDRRKMKQLINHAEQPAPA